MIDTHAHLTSLDDADEAIARAAEAGVARILAVGTDVENCRRTLELADRHEGVFAILGLHPHEAGTASSDVTELRDLLAHRKAVAVGETGLDFYRDYAPHDRQRELFERQLDLAAELDKTVVVHTRAASEETAAAPTRRASCTPVRPMLTRLRSAVITLARSTVRNFPITISGRVAGLMSRVSIVPRSFSPAQRSTAG